MLEVTTVSDEGFASENEVREFTTTVDATGEEAPDTLESLLAAYGSCYVPALRVGAEQRDVGDLGRVEIAVRGELNDDDKLESIAFDVTVDADVNDEQAEQIIERANSLCKVGDAVKESLKADVSIETTA